MLHIKKFRKKEIIIILLLALGFLIPLVSLFSMTLCDAPSINECLLKKSNLFSDFFLHYNTMQYIANYGGYPFTVSELVGGNWVQGRNYHAPLYHYFGAFLYWFAKKINISDLFLIYFSSTLCLLFVNLFFFFNIKQISKWIYGGYNKDFIIYALAVFLFLPVHLQAGIGLKNDTIALLFYMMAIFYYLKLLEFKEAKYSIYLGIILGLGLLTRMDSLAILVGFAFQMIFFHFKKENKMRNNLFKSVLLGSIIGLGTFIKNLVLYNNVLGDVTIEAARSTLYTPYTFFRVFRAYWGGIFGGNEHIKLILGLFIIILCLLIVLGLVLYFKKHRNNALDIFLMITASTFIMLFFFMCDISNLVLQGVCQGSIVQGRHFIVLNPFVAILVGIVLIKIKMTIKNKKLKVIPSIFIVMLSLLFIIDFLSAIV